jgi:hypothetical protein
MKVISTRRGSSRERVDARADLLPVAHWRVNWKDADNRPGFVRAATMTAQAENTSVNPS